MTARPDTAPRRAREAAGDAGLPAAAAPALRRPLRLGLLLDGTTAPRWVERVLRRLADEGIAEIALVVLNGASQPPATAARRGLAQRLGTWYRNRHALGIRL